MSKKMVQHFRPTDAELRIGWRRFTFLDGCNLSLAVSKDGRVWTSKRRDGTFRGNKMANGYYVAGSTAFQGLVHRMVYEVFEGPIPDGMEIDHINTIRGDNRIENLRVVTKIGNRRNPLSYPRVVESVRNAQKVAAKTRRKRIYGVNVATGAKTEVFESINDAAAFAGVPAIRLSKALYKRRKGADVAGAAGYDWFLAEGSDHV